MLYRVLSKDTIVSVNGVSWDKNPRPGESLFDLVKTGDTAIVCVKFGMQIDTLRMVRASVIFPNIIVRQFNDGLYINLKKIQRHMFSGLVRMLRTVDLHGTKNMVIDLRYNPGGSLHDMRDFLEAFLKTGDTSLGILRTSGKQYFVCASDGLFSHCEKITVLVNHLSASASETFAMVVRMRRGALIVGDTTCGKALIQEAEILNGIQLYFTAGIVSMTGAPVVQGVGLIPDIVCPFSTVVDRNVMRKVRKLSPTPDKKIADASGLRPEEYDAVWPNGGYVLEP
ncbi:MAG: S41 family peptidase [Candidatus Kapaibacterium sp.]